MAVLPDRFRFLAQLQNLVYHGMPKGTVMNNFGGGQISCKLA